MKLKTLALVVAIIFLLTQSGCASLNKNQMQTTTAYSENPVADFDTQMKKNEREWLLMALIVLGIVWKFWGHHTELSEFNILSPEF